MWSFTDPCLHFQPFDSDPALICMYSVCTLEDVLESLIQEQIYDEYDRAERKRLDLARWGFNRWRLFVKKSRKARGDPSYQQIQTGPKILEVIEQATDAAAKGELPTETTSLLGKLNPLG